ncbi:MAG: hypothetical protein WBB33_04120 [Candidatus Saccharimonadales bacterium]
MKRSTTLLLYAAPLLLAAILYGLFTFVDPASADPGAILGVFVLIYLECLSIVFVVLHFGLKWVSKYIRKRKSVGNAMSHKSYAVGVRKAYYIASIVSFAPVTLLAMHSFAQLRLIDIVLVFVFTGIATFYIVKRGQVA